MRSLMYHDVVENGNFASSGFPGEGANVYKLRREDFERHLDAIQHEANLTFDDGGASFHRPIADLLEARGRHGYFFITTDRIGTTGFLTEAQIRDLDRRGHVIGSHSASHPTRMATLTRSELDREWSTSIARLSGILGRPVTVASVPGGYYSREVARSAAAAGIRTLFTSEPTAAIDHVDGCEVIGRYVVKRGMAPEWSAGFASGSPKYCWRQAALWKAKRVAKALGGRGYLKVRQAILRMLTLLLCMTAFGQLRDRVLILVNDRMRESVEVGQYYAQRRQIPPSNILRLKTNTGETMSLEEYKEQIENPLRKFLDRGLKQKILYIVPVYGIPLKVPDKFAVDSLIAYMYTGHEDAKPPLRNLYYGETGSRPPHFAEWSDGPAAANNFKMFVVTRLDGPTPEIAKGLVDKAIEGERSVNRKSGVTYFDYQGYRAKGEWQWAVDDEVRDGAERARAAGFETVLHTQARTSCHSQIAPATAYYWNADRKWMMVSAVDSTGGFAIPLPGVEEADFTARFEPVNTGMQNSVTVTLGDARLVYPFVPFTEYDPTAEIVLTRGAARAVLKVKNEEKVINSVGELKLSVRKGRVTAYRNGAELVALEGAPSSPIASAGVEASCWVFGVSGLHAEDASGKTLWSDTFGTDSSARYQWKITPVGAPNALWVWGWYSPATDSYRFVPGAIGAQLTSYTADRIRTPNDPNPKVHDFNAERWKGNWVPRMLEEGVTATWGSVAEPYATFYARGPNVFDHIWAGYNFGDSFYIAENAARWVMVAVGDPLYAPAAFARKH